MKESNQDSRYDNFYDWHFLNMELDDDYQDIIPSEKGDVFIAINKCIDVLESDSVSDSEKSNIFILYYKIFLTKYDQHN